MFNWRDLSFPTRITALLIAAVLIVGTVFLVNRFVFGEVTFSSPQKNAAVFRPSKDTTEFTLPHTYRIKPGKETFQVSAPGYVDQSITLKVPAFRHQNKTVNLSPIVFSDPQKAPLGSLLPQTNNHFEIDLPNPDGTYTITLFAILNRPEQYDEYQAQLTKYGQEAFNWIRSKGVNPSDLKIKWVPQNPDNVK